jgi:hypothetical protein
VTGEVDIAALRTQARAVARASDWEPVLQRFEQRLREVVATMDVFGHASLA